MAAATQVIPCIIATLVFWTAVGYPLARRLAPALALPLSPVLGWAVHSVLALWLFRVIGFTPATVAIGSLLILSAAALLLLLPHPPGDAQDSMVRIPVWGYGLAVLIAAIPALAGLPKISGDAVSLAPSIFDHSKIAIIDEMARLGIPPGNPFYAADGPLTYYYLWHFSAAEIAVLFGIGGWNADVAMTAFTAFSSLALMMGLAAWIGGRTSAGLWVLPLALAASLHPVLEFLIEPGRFYSLILPPSGLAGWLFQTTWAPQHVASASCVLVSIYLLARAAHAPSPLCAAVLALTAAAGYESSTWVGGVAFGVAAPATALVLIVLIPPQARFRFAASAAGAGVVTAVLVFPFLRDQFISAAARDIGAPIIFRPLPVFGVSIPENLRRIFDIPGYWLVLLLIEFPAIYAAGVVSLAHTLCSGAARALDRLTSIAFAVLAIAAFLITGYFTITFVDNNDLGWRAVLPGIMVLTVFAATGLSRWFAQKALLAVATALLLLLLALPRSIEIALLNLKGDTTEADRDFAATPALWDAVRRHAGPAERVVNNPFFMRPMTPWPINISWAVLADRRSCFAGSDYMLPFTSLSRRRIAEIGDQFDRVFAGRAAPNDISDLAVRYRCDVIALTPQDGAWSSDPFATSPLYRLAEEKAGRWRIYRISGLEQRRAQ